MKTFFIVLFGFIIAFGCKKQEVDLSVVVPVENKSACDTTLAVVWQIPADPDSNGYSYISFLDFNDTFIYSYFSLATSKGEMGFFNFDNEKINYLVRKPTGKGAPTLLVHGIKQAEVFFDDVLAFISGTNVYGLHRNGEIVWVNEFGAGNKDGYGGLSLSNFKSLVFYPSSGYDNVSDIQLFGIDINTGSKRVLAREPSWDNKNKWAAEMDAPVGYLFQKDTIVAYQIRKSGGYLRYSTDLVAWNITKNEQLWRVDSLDRFGTGTFNTPIFENGKIYLSGVQDVYCLDAFTGSIIWRQDFEKSPYRMKAHNLLLLDHGLIVKSTDHEMALLDKTTGKIIWENRDMGTDPGQLTFYKGDIISINWGTESLGSVNSYTGRTNWKTGSVNNCINSQTHYARSRFVINPKTNLLYISDNYYIQCLKLPGYD